MSNNIKPFSVKVANPDLHAKPILDMIKELALFEKMSVKERVKNTVADLTEDLNKGHCHALVAISGEKTIGYALYYYAYSTWEGRFIFMEDLYVTPAYRRRGVGTSLWAHVAKIAVAENLCRIQWSVMNWNSDAIAFYKRRGAVDLHETEGWIEYRLPRKQIDAVASATNSGAAK